jgi:SagB-type dehydrogenase family enzyme
VRIERGRLALQAPDARCQVYLAPAAAGAWAEVAAHQVPAAAWWPELARMLAAAGALRETPATPEETLWSVAEWSAYLHARRSDTVSGFAGTYRGAQIVPVPSARWEPDVTSVLDLPRPDLDRLKRTDPPLTAVSEARRSRREHDGARPITLNQLSELLYRVARVRAVLHGEGVEAVDRPVPAGGSLHEIEVLVASQHCDGLEPGLWWYDGHRHRLARIAETGTDLERLVRYAATATLQEQLPQILLEFAARPARLLTKYESIGYALMEKHTGVLMHAVYLAAEAMGLATCGVGAGDGAAFAAATRRGPDELAPLGEMTLGSRVPDGSDGDAVRGGR